MTQRDILKGHTFREMAFKGKLVRGARKKTKIPWSSERKFTRKNERKIF